MMNDDVDDLICVCVCVSRVSRIPALLPEALLGDVPDLLEVKGAKVVPPHQVELTGAQCASCVVQVLVDDGFSLKSRELFTRENRQAC